MTNIVALDQNSTLQHTNNFNSKQLELIKNQFCKDLTDDEFEIFIMNCRRANLDPLAKQIYCVKRKCKGPNGKYIEVATTQTGIDGFRLIADRTGLYAPGPEPTYTLDENGNLLFATAYLKKQTRDGTWHTVSASAYLDEYCQTYTDSYTGEKKAKGLWATMPRTMLAKCAESQALRKAFPAEMSGIYTSEEMQQADIEEIEPKLTSEQAQELYMILDECDQPYKDWFYRALERKYKTTSFFDLSAKVYADMKKVLTEKMEECRKAQREQYEQQQIANQ